MERRETVAEVGDREEVLAVGEVPEVDGAVDDGRRASDVAGGVCERRGEEGIRRWFAVANHEGTDRSRWELEHDARRRSRRRRRVLAETDIAGRVGSTDAESVRAGRRVLEREGAVAVGRPTSAAPDVGTARTVRPPSAPVSARTSPRNPPAGAGRRCRRRWLRPR